MDSVDAKTGSVATITKEPSHKSPWSFLKGLKERIKRQPVKEAEVHEEDSIIFDTPERLKPAGIVLFHTAPEGNLPALVEKGLYGHRKDPNISENIGYSLFFPYEHAISRKKGSPTFSNEELNPRVATPENYILTVWQPNSEVRKSKGVFGKSGFREVKGDTGSVIPEEYFQSSMHGSSIRNQSELIGRVGPENLLAAITLNRSVRDEILRLMVLAAKGRMSADQIEVGLQQKLSQEGGAVFLRDGLELSVLTHLLTNSIERRLVKSVVVPSVEYFKSSDSSLDFDDRSNEYRGYPLKALWLVMKYRANVNDVATARYLDGARRAICKRIQEQGGDVASLIKRYEENIAKLGKGEDVGSDLERQFSSYSDNSSVDDFYGNSTISLLAADSMERELGFK